MSRATRRAQCQACCFSKNVLTFPVTRIASVVASTLSRRNPGHDAVAHCPAICRARPVSCVSGEGVVKVIAVSPSRKECRGEGPGSRGAHFATTHGKLLGGRDGSNESSLCVSASLRDPLISRRDAETLRGRKSKGKVSAGMGRLDRGS